MGQGWQNMNYKEKNGGKAKHIFMSLKESLTNTSILTLHLHILSKNLSNKLKMFHHDSQSAKVN